MKESQAIAEGLRIIQPRFAKHNPVSKKERKRVLAFLCYLAEYKYDEIVGFTELSKSTIKRYIRRRLELYPHLKSSRMWLGDKEDKP